MRTSWSFHTAGRLTFGPRSVDQLGRLAKLEPGHKVLVVTDGALIDSGAVARVEKSVQRAGAEVVLFSDGEPEPSTDTALRAAELAQAEDPDAIIGLGGGSNMDLAKITAAVHTHGGQPRDYFGFDRIPGPVTPLICVPTTAGTGSEVSHAAVLTDRQNAIKVSSLSNWLRPRLAIVDPELTYTCPPAVAAASGIDALTHAIEAYTARNFDQLQVAAGEDCAYEGSFPLASCVAEEAIRRLGQHLASAVESSANHAARDQVALAATMAGIAFSNAGVALVHALEYPMGAALHCSHGAGNGLLLPYVMRFNLPARTAEFARIAELLGVDRTNMSDADAAEAAIAAVEDLRRQIGIPERIRDLGGTEEQLAAFAAKAFEIKRLMETNPRSPSQEDLLNIFKAAW